jgi:hypothetical protein
MTSTADSASLSTTLPIAPFTDLAVQFGMLLGVADFDALAANPRGKMRLHNAWLHGEGVVWGYPISVDSPTRELKVGPGLALDQTGHELYLSAPACLDLGAWFDTASADTTNPLTHTTVAGGVQFDAYLVVRFKSCLSQPVPAMSSPCEGAPTGVAYSRVNETVELLLRPNDAPQPTPTFPNLRWLLGIAGGAPPPNPPATGIDDLEALRTVAADEIAGLEPIGLENGKPDSSLLFPADDPVDLVLAQLTVVLSGTGDTRTATLDNLDLSVRSSHVPTATMLEFFSSLATGPDAGGPRIDPTSAHWSGSAIVVTTAGTFLPGTIDAGCLVESLDPSTPTNSWVDEPFTTAFDGGANTLTFTPTTPPTSAHYYRVLVSGAGMDPVMGTVAGKPVAFAGAVGGPAGSAALGAEVAFMLQAP